MENIKEVKNSEEIETPDNQDLRNISLWMDDYDDIFSDFDPRPYSNRALSVDFLDEAKRAAKDKQDSLELNLLVKENLRDVRTEAIIKNRLKAHFKKHTEEIKKEVKGDIIKGAIFVAIGAILMIISTLVAIRLAQTSILKSILIVLFDPAGWFFFWDGMDTIITEPKKARPNLTFYKKMSQATINFRSYQ